MKHRKLGRNGPDVSELGLGCMSLGIADIYTSSIKSDEDAVKLVHRSLELGITFLDTADIYGDSEDKVGKAIHGKRDRVFLATKFGFVRGGGAAGRMVNGSPAYAREACDSSLKRLGVDYIDLYQMHRIDDQVPVEQGDRLSARIAIREAWPLRAHDSSSGSPCRPASASIGARVLLRCSRRYASAPRAASRRARVGAWDFRQARR